MTTPPIIDAEFKALMSPLSAEEYAQLEQNILAGKKCNDAILLWNGIIVDGMNRYAICAEHEIEFSVVDMSFDSREDVKIWIIENQLGRRNLHAAARIELALCKEKLLREKAKINLKRGGKPSSNPSSKWPKLKPEDAIDVQKEIADVADVAAGTLSMYNHLS